MTFYRYRVEKCRFPHRDGPCHYWNITRTWDAHVVISGDTFERAWAYVEACIAEDARRLPC